MNYKTKRHMAIMLCYLVVFKVKDEGVSFAASALPKILKSCTSPFVNWLEKPDNLAYWFLSFWTPKTPSKLKLSDIVWADWTKRLNVSVFSVILSWL